MFATHLLACLDGPSARMIW